MLWTGLLVGAASAPDPSFATATTALGLSFLLAAKAPLASLLRLPSRSQTVWLFLYCTAGGLLLLPLATRISPELFGYSIGILVLAVPWYLHGLRKKREMKIRFEIPAMALLALAAPLASSASGNVDFVLGSMLWSALFVFYVASSFRVRVSPVSRTRIPGVVYSICVLLVVCAAAVAGVISRWIPLAFLPLVEDVYRGLHPRKEKISFLGRLELLKTLWFALLLIVSVRT